MVINEKHSMYKALIEACSDDRILVESDYNDISMSTPQTWEMLKIVAEIKKWTIERVWLDSLADSEWGAVRYLERNWRKFRDGHHTPAASRRSIQRRRKVNGNLCTSPS